LDFKIEENSPFFVSLFKYTQLLGRRGCNRTALELCKFILSLDPTDPLFVLLSIDYYAIRSGEYEFLFKLYNEFENAQILQTLPNFSFSLALAKFIMENNGMHGMDALSSNELLQRALLHFPMVIVPLFKKCGFAQQFTLEGKTIDLPYDRFFVETYRPPSLEHLITIFVDRSYSLWKLPEVIAWLQKNILATMERVKQGDPLIAIYLEDVKSKYSSSASNTFRHLLLSDYTDAVNSLPPDVAQNIFQTVYNEDVNIPLQTNVVPALTNNPLGLFLTSLFPWNPIPNAPAGATIPSHQLINNANEDENDDDSDADLDAVLDNDE